MGTIKVVPRPDGAVPRRRKVKTRCIDCGVWVNSYNRPYRKDGVRCYLCDDKRPWTYDYLMSG